jgi:hypothetical protein
MDGSRYQVNPDRSLTELPENALITVSPDGAHVAFKTGDGMTQFQYISTVYRDASENTPQKPGQAARFSGDSNRFLY